MVRIIRDKVAGGRYSSNSEVIRETLRGWLDQERRLQTLDASINQGLMDADAGHVHGLDSVRAAMQQRFGEGTPQKPA